MSQRLNIILMFCILALFVFTSVVAGQIEVLRPGGTLNRSDYDTLSWRTLDEPTTLVLLPSYCPGESIAVWFQPSGPCSLIALRLMSNSYEGTCLADVWDGSHYDGHITTTDSTDSCGWIGYDEDGQWLPGNVIGHSPIGWDQFDRERHIWGPFPFVITEDHLGKWFEIPARAGLQKEIDLGDKPFFISITTYITAGHGWAVEDEGTTPFHSFYYYYPGCRPGPSGNFGWHIQSPSVWFEAIVKYYELISRVHIDYYCVDDDSIGQSNGDGNGQSDPGETVELRVAIISSGVDIFGLMATLSTDDPAVVVSVDTVEYGDLSPDESTENTQTPFIISIESDVETHLAKFYLTFTTQDEYTKIDSFYVTIGKPLVLLVDDDGSDTYQDIYHYCLSENAVPFQTWEVERQGSPINKLNEHEIVIWFTGQSRENTLTQDDQASLISYLDNGGRLFLCGQDIGYDLFEKGNGVDFYTNYLRAQWMQDNSEDGFITSVPEDPISGDISGFLLIQENNENDYLRSPDVITPLLGATPVFEYSQTGKTAGLKYAAGYRLVYFAFPFENLTNLRPDFQIMKVDLLASIIDWLKGNPTNIEINESEVTSLREYSLSQNYPNPFNAQTKINYVIATDCMVTLEIYNLLGEKVTTLIDAHQSPGTYAVSWDATDLPSGVYFFRINANSFTATRGMVFMK